MSLRPINLPPGGSAKWPTMVVESGLSGSHDVLDSNARWWIRKSNGHVRVVITVTVSRTEFTVKRYAPSGRTRAAICQTITVSRREHQPTRVTGGPLRIPFRDVFLRAPRGNQRDLYTHRPIWKSGSHVPGKVSKSESFFLGLYGGTQYYSDGELLTSQFLEISKIRLTWIAWRR